MQKTLHVDLRVGQSMTIGGASVSLEEKSGRLARLKITAPPGVEIKPPLKPQGAAQAKMLGALAPT